MSGLAPLQGARAVTRVQRASAIFCAAVALAVVTLLVTACGNSGGVGFSSRSDDASEGTRNGASTLKDLHSLEDLRAEFRGHDGSTRIILLLSPT